MLQDTTQRIYLMEEYYKVCKMKTVEGFDSRLSCQNHSLFHKVLKNIKDLKGFLKTGNIDFSSTALHTRRGRNIEDSSNQMLT